MADEMAQAIAQGSGAKICEISPDPVCIAESISETVETSRPDFDQIKHLCSDKPLRFSRPRIQTVRVIVGKLGSLVRMSAHELDMVVEGETRDEAWREFLQAVGKRDDGAWLTFDVGPTRPEEIAEGLNVPEDEDWAEPVEGAEM
jgi:hypothetical protein